MIKYCLDYHGEYTKGKEFFNAQQQITRDRKLCHSTRPVQCRLATCRVAYQDYCEFPLPKYIHKTYFHLYLTTENVWNDNMVITICRIST